MVRQRVRIRFRKQGDLRWIGHLDLARAWERLFRRAGIPLAMSEGFHPKPKMQFPLALALSVEGLDEDLEVQIDSDATPEQLLAALGPQLPAGLAIVSIELATNRRAAQVRAVAYELPVPAERQAQVQSRLDELLAAPVCLVDRGRGRAPLDLRPRLADARLTDGVLRLRMWITREGGVKPAEVLAVLGIDDLLRSGQHLTRTAVELEAEQVSGTLGGQREEPSPTERPPKVPDTFPQQETSVQVRSIALPHEKARE